MADEEGISLQPPLIRTESALGEDGQQVHLLSALRPEQGWPRLWAWIPVRLDEDDRVEAIGAPFVEPFLRAAQDIGEPLRHALPLQRFPPALPGERRGLLGLFVYAHERALAVEGARPAARLALEALLEAVLAGEGGADPQWQLGLVLRPDGAGEEGGDGAARGELSFVLAACQYPPGVLDHSPDALARPDSTSPAEASLARLVAYCRRHPSGRQASLLILAGDEIYADASSGLFDANNQIERYARPYMQFKAGVIRHLPPSLRRVVHIPDDHEIEDGWEPIAGAPTPPGPQGLLYAAARQAAWTHRWDARPGPAEAGAFWHAFDWRGAAFFIADSRGERQPRRWDLWRDAQMIGQAQREALYAWLKQTAGRPRFVASSALLLPRRRATREHAASCLRSDAWDGYPASLHGLLAELWAQQARDVVFLSGDEHRSGHVSVEIEAVDGGDDRPPLRLYSIHSSALYAPWPFAITRPEEFAAPEAFEFDGQGGQRLRCRVGAWVDHPGDGFLLLRLAADGMALQLWFDRAARPLHSARGETSDGLPAADASLELDPR
ncbi:alkaline phosphatase D family protein [Roseateles violae]|uniref:Alkaline phosphatase D family protein n=1 Tax=Roseateles violae TaxID=3058042 RepID=A0ABT8DMN3_9BURK|nr:alkaline phosphatase D family protein [Pelomonas sp. PFR6]MDN3919655.1 alkaline phosphatase D family protein [Pelomonas sp. PFR6]